MFFFFFFWNHLKFYRNLNILLLDEWMILRDIWNDGDKTDRHITYFPDFLWLMAWIFWAVKVYK